MTNHEDPEERLAAADRPPRALGLGPLPGTSIPHAAEIVLGELSSFPHIPQLPQRGLGAGAVARTAALAEDVFLDRGPRGWRLSSRPQPARLRAKEILAQDLIGCEAAWGSQLPILKVQVLGPWSLAAAVELPRGHRVMTDPGAVRDLSAALADSVVRHAQEVGERWGARVAVQWDEPLLDHVLRGTVPGTSELDPIAPIAIAEVAQLLFEVFAPSRPVVSETLLNLTGYPVPWEVVRALDFTTVLVSWEQVIDAGHKHWDSFGALLCDGRRLGLGVKPPIKVEGAHGTATGIADFFRGLGLDRGLLQRRIDVHAQDSRSLLGGSLLDAAHAYRGLARVAELFARGVVE